MELPFKQIHVQKTKKSGAPKSVYKDHFFTGNLSWYHHPTFHDNVYVTMGYNKRRTYPNGFFTDWSPEIGYSRTFIGGTTYEVSETNTVSIKKMAGYHHVLVSIGGGLGYDFSITNSKPISVYYKLNLLTMFPYNSTVYLRPAMELGIIFKPKNFLMVESKNHTRDQK